MVDDEVTDSGGGESDLAPRPGRRRQAIGLITTAILVIALAGVAYLRPSVASQFGGPPLPGPLRAGGGPIGVGPQPPSPTPLRRSAGIVRLGAIDLLIEQFGGLNDQPPRSLKALAQVKSVTVINWFVQELNALPPFPNGIFCPMDDGSYFALVFTYPNQSTASLKVEASGCDEVFFGNLAQPVAWTATSPKFMPTLQSLLAHPGG